MPALNNPVVDPFARQLTHLSCSRSSNVTLQHLTLEGCKTHSSEGLIDVDYVDNVILSDMKFVNNKNSLGPSSISGSNSSIILLNNSAAGNMGGNGGLLGMVNCTVSISGGNFSRNSGYQGGSLFLSNCNLDLKNASFIESQSDLHGGAINVQVWCCVPN